MDRLNGIYLKLCRADEHLKTIEDEIHRFVKGHTYRIPGQSQPGSRQYLFNGELPASDLGPEWSPVIGDAVHNLHAVLDYLACQLALANPDNRDGGCETTAFPIFDTEAGFQKNGRRRIKNMIPAAQAKIKSLQPFAERTGAARIERHPLMLLYGLEQWDKHRMLHTTTVAHGSRIGGLPPNIVAPGPGPLVTSEGRAIQARWTAPQGYSEMDVYLETAPQVVFDMGGPAPGQSVLQTLINARHTITETVIPALELFLR